MSRGIYGSNPHTSLFLRQFNSVIQATSKHRSYRLLYDRVRNAAVPEARSHSSMRLQSRRERHAHQNHPISPPFSPFLPHSPHSARIVPSHTPLPSRFPRITPNPPESPPKNFFTHVQTTHQPPQLASARGGTEGREAMSELASCNPSSRTGLA